MSYYLDTAATTKPNENVVNEIIPYITELWHNPSSLYNEGGKVKKAIERTRKAVADCIHANENEIYFTSGASESNNWVIRGFDDAHMGDESLIVTTGVEHSSIIDAVNNDALRSKVAYCPVDKRGFVDKIWLEEYLSENKCSAKLVSVIMANNEIGTIQDIFAISDIVHEYDGIIHVDATQLFGHFPIDVRIMGIDLLSASAQKLGGIKGCGFLYKRNGVDIKPLIYGEQERGQRGGTENVVGIISLYVAVRDIDYTKNHEIEELRNYFIDKLEEIGCRLNGARHMRLPNNINVMLPKKVNGESMLYCLDTAGIKVSTGSACNSHSVVSSHVLKAIGLSDEEAARCIRITIDNSLTKSDIDNIVSEIEKGIRVLSDD